MLTTLNFIPGLLSLTTVVVVLYEDFCFSLHRGLRQGFVICDPENQFGISMLCHSIREKVGKRAFFFFFLFLFPFLSLSLPLSIQFVSSWLVSLIYFVLSVLKQNSPGIKIIFTPHTLCEH
jgi:hypothetical protein